MSLRWEPNTVTLSVIQEFIKAFVTRVPALLGIEEIIPGCELLSLDPYGVGVTTIPRYVTVTINDYGQPVWYNGNLALVLGDFYTVIHLRVGDRYEILGPSGATGSSGGSWTTPPSTYDNIVIDSETGEVVVDSVTGTVVYS
jgi:hypothetical protein